MDPKIAISYAYKWTGAAWWLGLAYHQWLSSDPAHMALWRLALLTVIGGLLSAVVIAGTLLAAAAWATQKITGNQHGSSDLFSWVAFIAPALTFWISGYAAHWWRLIFSEIGFTFVKVGVASRSLPGGATA